MTPATRATALVLSVLVDAFAFAASVAFFLAVREPAPDPRHLKVVERRCRPARRHEWLMWTVSAVIRFYRYEDGAPKSAAVFASLFLLFALVIGANQ